MLIADGHPRRLAAVLPLQMHGLQLRAVFAVAGLLMVRALPGRKLPRVRKRRARSSSGAHRCVVPQSQREREGHLRFLKGSHALQTSLKESLADKRCVIAVGHVVNQVRVIGGFDKTVASIVETETASELVRGHAHRFQTGLP